MATDCTTSASAPESSQPFQIWFLPLAYALVIVSFLFLSLLEPILSYDAGWNIRMGQSIWNDGHLPDHEPLLFTSAIPTPDFHISDDYIAESQATKDVVLKSHWLGQVAFYGAWSVHETIGPIVLRTLLFMLAVLSIIWSLRSLSMPWSWSLAGGIIGLILLDNYILARPSLFSIALVALSMALWIRLWVTSRKRYAWLAIALLPLWAQLHVGFVYGVFLALGWIICLMGERFFAKKTLIGHRAWQRSSVLAAHMPLSYSHLTMLAIIAMVIPLSTYPPGIDALLGFLDNISGMPVLSDEMTPIKFSDDPRFFALFGSAMLVAISCWRYLPLPMWACLIAVTIAPFLMKRNSVLFITVGLPVLLYGFYQLVQLWRKKRITSSLGQTGIHIVLGLVMLVFIADFIRTRTVLIDSQNFTWPRSRFPVLMAQFINAYPPPGRPMHPYHIGGYLELSVPEIKWFLDGRYYKPRLISYSVSTNNNHELRHKMLDYYQVDWMIIPILSANSKQFSIEFADVAAEPEWIPVAFLDTFGLFVRKSNRTMDYLAKHTLSYQKWHKTLLTVLINGGFNIMGEQERSSATLMALYLTLAGYIDGLGPNHNIMAPEKILTNVSPKNIGYPMAQKTLSLLPLFQQRTAAMLAQLPGGEAYLSINKNMQTQIQPPKN